MTTLLLPKHFFPTHKTSGLPGFPAIDCFAKAGTMVVCEFGGTVVKLSGHAPTPTTPPGGPYGWSIYLRTKEGTYFLTHFGSRSPVVRLGHYIPAHTVIGRVANYSGATNGKTPSHIHEGFHRGSWTP